MEDYTDKELMVLVVAGDDEPNRETFLNARRALRSVERA
jgi:hypothetical protein